MNSRYKQIYDLRKRGLTFRKIGEIMELSPGRARQIHEVAEFKLRSHRVFVDGLSTRAANVIFRLGIESREGILQAFGDGTLHPKNPRCGNFGWGSFLEVAKWLGLPEPKKPYAKRAHLTTCPHCGARL